ncbi:hypothetical protein Agabi119p4_7852 [Agaricus bisporus var. burnettii]|uniref:Uncharacterized protein n=1 Tax=Agaricus bisporus var. burnettii TaxID=192524 RepID=A0A8H7C7P4_AGABI|nr:hypothetical protein Agabi119p4_7852 [Agaricus bisporus var. burnettii]
MTKRDVRDYVIPARTFFPHFLLSGYSNAEILASQVLSSLSESLSSTYYRHSLVTSDLPENAQSFLLVVGNDPTFDEAKQSIVNARPSEGKPETRSTEAPQFSHLLSPTFAPEESHHTIGGPYNRQASSFSLWDPTREKCCW